MSWLTKIDVKLIAWWGRVTRPAHRPRHLATGLSTMEMAEIFHTAVRRVQAEVACL